MFLIGQGRRLRLGANRFEICYGSDLHDRSYCGTARSIRSEAIIDETSNGLRQCGPIGLRLGPGLDCRSRLVGQVQLRNQIGKFAIVGRNWPVICLEFSASHGLPPVFLNVSPLWSSNSLSETARTDLLAAPRCANAFETEDLLDLMESPECSE